MPRIEASFVRRAIAPTTQGQGSLALDSIDLALIARGELSAFDRTFYGLGGIYGSFILDAQRSSEGVITAMRNDIRSVDAGWIAGAGIELASIGTITPTFETRYQRGIRDLMPTTGSKTAQRSISFLLGITYGGRASAKPPTAKPRAVHSRNSGSPGKKRSTSVMVGRVGDRWLAAQRVIRIERSSRNGKPGYQISYDIAGHGYLALFWPMDRIDPNGKSSGHRLQSMKLRKGRLWYPTRITARSLPQVHRGILLLEEAYAKQANGMTSILDGFALITALGSANPTMRATGPRSAPARSSQPRAKAKRAPATATKGGAKAPGSPASRGNTAQGSTGVVPQLTPNSCGPSCGVMLLGDRGIGATRSQIASRSGVLTSARSLARGLNAVDDVGTWLGAGVSTSSFGALNKTGSWAAMLWKGVGAKVGHWVVVDGVKAGAVGRIKMTIDDFMERWNGFAVWRQ